MRFVFIFLLFIFCISSAITNLFLTMDSQIPIVNMITCSQASVFVEIKCWRKRTRQCNECFFLNGENYYKSAISEQKKIFFFLLICWMITKRCIFCCCLLCKWERFFAMEFQVNVETRQTHRIDWQPLQTTMRAYMQIQYSQRLNLHGFFCCDSLK